jgi:hypothetical protein
MNDNARFPRLNVLIIPGGTEIASEIWRSLKDSKDIRLFSASSNTSNHAPYIFSDHFIIPSISDLDNFIDNLNQIIDKQKIDYIFPAYDDMIVALVRNIDKIKAPIASSPLETCLITRSKSHTYHTLQDIVPVPKLFNSIDDVHKYPVFLKPDQGQGSQRTHLVDNSSELQYLLNKDNDYIIMEYLPGEEYTVDCFSDRDAGLLFCGGRQRVRIKNGISMNSILVDHDIFRKYALSISGRLTFHGAWFFQLKKDLDGIFKLLEVAPRIAGTMAIHRVQGINFALLSIYEQQRMPLRFLNNNLNIEIDRSLVNRYKYRGLQYNTVYIAFENTLLLNDRININIIQLLYQCVNKNIKIILLTTHTNNNIEHTLRKHRLYELFDEIIHIEQPLGKVDYIREINSILIDNSFTERKTVSDQLGILTFDYSMLEMLIDERV